jgi:NAD(P)-dependent dehydrogenase (short-subunit alcohol dehydrogenase family)
VPGHEALRVLAGEVGDDAAALHPDIASEDGVKSLVQAALDSFGRTIFDEQQRQRFADVMTLGRVCEPEDVAEVVAFLASPASGYVNWAAIDVDGDGAKPVISW